MTRLTIRNLEDDVKLQLMDRAKQRGSSLEEEVRQILRDAVRCRSPSSPGLGSRIAARFAETGLSAELPELKAQAARPLRCGD